MNVGLATLRDLCLYANDPARVGAFWGAVLGREPADAGHGDGTTHDVVLRENPASPGPTIWVNGVPEPKTGKVRLHLDVATGNAVARRSYERYGFVATGETRPIRDGSADRVERMVLR